MQLEELRYQIRHAAEEAGAMIVEGFIRAEGTASPSSSSSISRLLLRLSPTPARLSYTFEPKLCSSQNLLLAKSMI